MGTDKNTQLAGINHNKYTFGIINSSEPRKKFINQPHPLPRHNSVKFCQNFWNLSHETAPLKGDDKAFNDSRLIHSDWVFSQHVNHQVGFWPIKYPLIILSPSEDYVILSPTFYPSVHCQKIRGLFGREQCQMWGITCIPAFCLCSILEFHL